MEESLVGRQWMKSKIEIEYVSIIRRQATTYHFNESAMT